MKLILTLGNPGDRYRDTRHNAGWWLADHLATRWSLGAFRQAGPEVSVDGRVEGHEVRIIKPMTYMNRSGRVLSRYLAVPGFCFEDDLLVALDDAALPPGRFRLKGRGSAGGHNGLQSVEEVLDSREYSRLRIGVGAPTHPDLDLADWVLAVPSSRDEEAILEQFSRMALAVELWMTEGMESAMNAFNSA
ncbi:MAG: aminoacyl-tRNA hydrolase [Gemmatimonadetes bacterium]|nr:aminoacyl-tRNA hydrolase [Gemmatimonadota bacterium]